MSTFVLFALFVSTFICSEGSSLSRIVGGSNVDIRHYPWQASLRSAGSHICGASFIDEKWLITAAHCVNNRNVYDLSVGHGDSNTNNHVGVPVYKYIVHPDYIGDGSLGYPNDIALLELAYPVTFGSYTNKIALPENNIPLSQCRITGWGCYDMIFGEFCQFDSFLKGTTIQILDTNACKYMWPYKQIQNIHVCLFESSKSACGGDSGSPLSCLQNGKTVLGGTASWGSSTCSGELPSVYARVSMFVSWIRQQTGLSL